ncbi:MAG: hypothetical protein LC797_05565 [Chloroflexi bacterium]|nr:hypothetical protein [Chloroflexota bacterium]
MSLAEELKAYAREIGFHLVGITSPEPFAQAELDITPPGAATITLS